LIKLVSKDFPLRKAEAQERLVFLIQQLTDRCVDIVFSDHVNTEFWYRCLKRLVFSKKREGNFHIQEKLKDDSVSLSEMVSSLVETWAHISEPWRTGPLSDLNAMNAGMLSRLFRMSIDCVL